MDVKEAVVQYLWHGSNPDNWFAEIVEDAARDPGEDR